MLWPKMAIIRCLKSSSYKEINALATWTEIKTPHKQQISHIQSSTQTYGIQLWGMASTSNTDILGRFQSKVLHMIVDASWYMPNTVI
jgi:hypothetical protein